MRLRQQSTSFVEFRRRRWRVYAAANFPVVVAALWRHLAANPYPRTLWITVYALTFVVVCFLRTRLLILTLQVSNKIDVDTFVYIADQRNCWTVLLPYFFELKRTYTLSIFINKIIKTLSLDFFFSFGNISEELSFGKK